MGEWNVPSRCFYEEEEDEWAQVNLLAIYIIIKKWWAYTNFPFFIFIFKIKIIYLIPSMVAQAPNQTRLGKEVDAWAI